MHPRDTTTLNNYAPKSRASKCMKQKLIEWQRKNRQIHNYNWWTQHFSKINRTIKQKINKDIKDLIITVNQLDLIDIARTLYTKTIECRFSSSIHQRFAEVDLILSNKTRLNKIEIIQII